MQLIAHVGEAFRGLDKLLNIQRYTSLEILKKLSHWSNSTPIWELQKQSQTLALEHWIGVVNSGPFKHTLQNVIAAMVMRQGFVNYEQHGWKLNFECGLSDYLFWRKSRENADLSKFGIGLHRAHYQQKNSTNTSRLTMILVKS